MGQLNEKDLEKVLGGYDRSNETKTITVKGNLSNLGGAVQQAILNQFHLRGINSSSQQDHSIIISEFIEVCSEAMRNGKDPLTPYTCLLYTSPSPRDS